ncbi:hypothetical protein LIA77_02908 [Sarocladium implicatum]|nr:hypothetical protein LIA77_02908 [Sarocladium implicatum]
MDCACRRWGRVHKRQSRGDIERNHIRDNVRKLEAFKDPRSSCDRCPSYILPSSAITTPDLSIPQPHPLPIQRSNTYHPGQTLDSIHLPVDCNQSGPSSTHEKAANDAHNGGCRRGNA